jgi:spore germination cell wall hydrolase CwlJ-like protein
MYKFLAAVMLLFSFATVQAFEIQATDNFAIEDIEAIDIATVTIKTVDIEPVKLETKEDVREIECLARNVYFESRGEPLRGRYAVANVTMNRVADNSFPSNVCGVVHQKNRRACQFSWVCKPYSVRDKEAYQNALDIARKVYYNEISDITSGAQYFHASYVNPSWSRKFQRTLQVGMHYFYKE